MAEIIVRLHPRRFEDEEQLVKRIARIVARDDSFCQQQRDGYKWGLNVSGNDWWASGIEKDTDGKPYIKVAYRYGHGGKHAKMLEALKTVLEWNFGPDDD